MKKITSIIAFVTLGFFAQAQNAKSGTVEYNKNNVACVYADYQIEAGLLEDALQKKMADAKLGKGDKSKGFKVYKGVILSDISTEKMDIYTKVDGKKGNSTAYIMASKGYDNFATPTDDPKITENLINFLNSFAKDAVIFQLMNEKEQQQKVTDKANEKYKDAVKEGEDYAKDLEKLQKRIEDNKKDQEAFKKEAAKQDDLLKDVSRRIEDVKVK